MTLGEKIKEIRKKFVFGKNKFKMCCKVNL